MLRPKKKQRKYDNYRKEKSEKERRASNKKNHRQAVNYHSESLILELSQPELLSTDREIVIGSGSDSDSSSDSSSDSEYEYGYSSYYNHHSEVDYPSYHDHHSEVEYHGPYASFVVYNRHTGNEVPVTMSRSEFKEEYQNSVDRFVDNNSGCERIGSMDVSVRPCDGTMCHSCFSTRCECVEESNSELSEDDDSSYFSDSIFEVCRACLLNRCLCGEVDMIESDSEESDSDSEPITISRSVDNNSGCDNFDY
jgi:hypothetical protein